MVTYMRMYGYKINDNVSNACLKIVMIFIRIWWISRRTSEAKPSRIYIRKVSWRQYNEDSRKLWCKISKDFKGVRWMPWRYQPKKDAVSCDKLRRGASNLRPVDFRMGEPGSGYALSPIPLSMRRAPGELKHLITQRKSNQTRFS